MLSVGDFRKSFLIALYCTVQAFYKVIIHFAFISVNQSIYTRNVSSLPGTYFLMISLIF
jgi:hypothetical protein